MWFLLRHIIWPLLIDATWAAGLQSDFGISASLWFMPVPFIIGFLPLGTLLNLVIFIGGVASLMAKYGLL